MKKLLTLIVFLIASVTANAGDHKANIVVVTHGSDTDAFWGVVRNGVEYCCKRHWCSSSV